MRRAHCEFPKKGCFRAAKAMIITMKNKTFSFLLCVMASLLLIVALLFTALQLCMNQRDWYYEKYQAYGLSQSIGISEEEITASLWRLIDYMEGRVDSIQLTVTEYGKTVEMYNQQEIDHMVDVRALYQAWRGVRDFGLPGAAVLLLAALSLTPKGKRLGLVSRGFLAASAAFGAVLLGLGIWVAVDFNGFWVAFHHLFFTNDLWLMDYATCRMIRICPEQLFNDIVVRFGLLFLIPFGLLLAGAFWGKARARKREARS